MPDRRCHWISVIGLWLSFAQVAPVIAGENPGLADALKRRVTASDIGRMQVGVSVVQLAPEPQLVFEHQPTIPLKPASNQKIVTTAALLCMLPEDFAYQTILARRGKDLAIIGGGDPSTGDYRIAEKAGVNRYDLFYRWAEALREAGLTRIDGDLVFDDSVFDDQWVPESWRKQHDLNKWYAAPTGGLNFNDNCVDVVVKPGAAVGQPADVWIFPDTPWVKLVNRTTTASKGEPVVAGSGSGPITITVTRQVSRPGSVESPICVTVPDPGAFFAHACRTVLATRGIRIQGNARRERVRRPDGTLPEDVTVIAVERVRPMEIMWRANKSSLNVFAEAFLKTLGACDTSGRLTRQGTFTNGAGVVRRFLAQADADVDACVIDDGSGLSHSNRLTPRAIARVLWYMDLRPDREKWRGTFAEPGEEAGTLRARMKTLNGQVFAKTGSILGVSALSGYVDGPDGQSYAFSILCNDTARAAKGGATAKQLQDDVCRLLATWSSRPPSGGGAK